MRSGAIVIVAAGLVLAAAVAAFFVLTRSADSDLRPTSPDRERTPSSHASIKGDEESAPGVEDLQRETMPPVIPESQPPTDATGGAGAPAAGSVPSAQVSKESRAQGEASAAARGNKSPAGSAARTSSPVSDRATLPAAEPGVKTRTPASMPSPVKPALVEPHSSPAAPAIPAPASPAAAEPPSVAPARTPAPPSEPADDPPAPQRESPAPAPEGDAGGGSGPPALATPLPPDAGGSVSPEGAESASVGDVALGATMPTPAEAAGAGVPEVDAVQSLSSPIPLNRQAPVYPPSALVMKTSGAVGLLVKVEADGHVSDVKVVRPAAPALNAAAVAAARQWSYKPAHRGMDAVATWIEETVVFRLK
jgi:protein TonB